MGLLLGTLAVAAGAAAILGGRLLLRDSSKPVPVAAAVAALRRGATASRAGGVYVYATSGGESISAFVHGRHAYPDRTGLAVVPTACGSRLQWDALQGRSTVWTLCRTRLGLEVRAEVETHRFFGRDDRTRYACTGELLGTVGGKTGMRSYVCRSARGRQTGQVRFLGRVRVRVGGRTLPALHVRTVGRVTGGDAGTETVDWWLAPTGGPPLRLVLRSRTSRPLPLGRAHYRENADLRLVSTTPRR